MWLEFAEPAKRFCKKGFAVCTAPLAVSHNDALAILWLGSFVFDSVQQAWPQTPDKNASGEIS